MKKLLITSLILALLSGCSLLPFKPIAPHIKIMIEVNLVKQEASDK